MLRAEPEESHMLRAEPEELRKMKGKPKKERCMLRAEQEERHMLRAEPEEERVLRAEPEEECMLRAEPEEEHHKMIGKPKKGRCVLRDKTKEKHDIKSEKTHTKKAKKLKLTSPEKCAIKQKKKIVKKCVVPEIKPKEKDIMNNSMYDDYNVSGYIENNYAPY